MSHSHSSSSSIFPLVSSIKVAAQLASWEHLVLGQPLSALHLLRTTSSRERQNVNFSSAGRQRVRYHGEMKVPSFYRWYDFRVHSKLAISDASLLPRDDPPWSEIPCFERHPCGSKVSPLKYTQIFPSFDRMHGTVCKKRPLKHENNIIKTKFGNLLIWRLHFMFNSYRISSRPNKAKHVVRNWFITLTRVIRKVRIPTITMKEVFDSSHFRHTPRLCFQMKGNQQVMSVQHHVRVLYSVDQSHPCGYEVKETNANIVEPVDSL